MAGLTESPGEAGFDMSRSPSLSSKSAPLTHSDAGSVTHTRTAPRTIVIVHGGQGRYADALTFYKSQPAPG